MTRARLATVWLDGCSGCHMSFLDMDERLLQIAEKVELVYSPLVDHKEFPENVDVTLVEGAVSSEEDLHKVRMIRQRTRVLVSLGDCAVTSNVPCLRNPVGRHAILQRAYHETATVQAQTPGEVIPALLPEARPVHEFVKVDVFIQGCPPHADTIFNAVHALLTGRDPATVAITKFG